MRKGLYVTPANHSAENGNTFTVGALLNSGADVNAKDKNGLTALIAASSQYPAVATVLIVQGADVNAKTRDGQTALVLASRAKQSQLVEFLKRHGAKE